jgi:hypothetical protein
MKNLVYATLLSAVMVLVAYKFFVGVEATIAAEQTKLNDLQTQLVAAQNATAKVRVNGRAASDLAPKLDAYIGRWSASAEQYRRISEQTQELLRTYQCQTIDNSLREEDRKVRVAGHDYSAGVRFYSVSGAYQNAVNYYGAFENKFDALSVQNLDINRKGDQLRIAVTMLIPKFDESP